MTKNSFAQELAEVKAREQAEIQKILEDPTTSLELKKLIVASDTEPFTKHAFSIEKMTEVEDPKLRDKNMPSPEQDFDDTEKRQVVEKILLTLTKKERKVVEMTFWEDKNQREIAAELSVSQQAVSRLLERGFEKIKENPLASEFWSSFADRTYPIGSHRDRGAE